MEEKRYKLRFLPLFEDDLSAIVDYICNWLHNPIAAANLVDAVEHAIQERQTCAEAFEPYRSKRERKYPYYRIHVKNYTVFYVVIDDVMEIRRILYGRRNYQNMI